MADLFSRRVNEEHLARILQTVATPPNRRDKAEKDDLQGEYDFWFDGGACKQHTGSQHYFFADGTMVSIVFPAAWLWLSVNLPDGEIVDVMQRRGVGKPTTAADRTEYN